MPNFMEIVQAVKKLNSISRERLNFRRRPILCTTLYRNPMQASNFGGPFDQLFLRIFLSNFHRRCLSTSSIQWCKKVKNDQKLKSMGGGGVLPIKITHAHLIRSFFIFSLLSLLFSLSLLFFSGNSVRSVALISIHPCFSAILPK